MKLMFYTLWKLESRLPVYDSETFLFCSARACYTFRESCIFKHLTFSVSESPQNSETPCLERGWGHTPPGCHQLNIWTSWQILVQEPVKPRSLQVQLRKLQWALQRGCSLGEHGEQESYGEKNCIEVMNLPLVSIGTCHKIYWFCSVSEVYRVKWTP